MTSSSPAFAALHDVLGCPVCARELPLVDGVLRCGAGHAFDIARQGYVSLLAGSRPAGAGDTADMVSARAALLERGHFEKVASALADAVLALDMPDGAAVVDLGGGTGYYLATVLDHATALRGVSVDISPFAARRAARCHPRAVAVRADVWQPLPLRARSVGAVLSVFGPRNPEEIARVLDPEHGRLVVVSPGQDHLRELVGPLGLLTVDPDKEGRLARQLEEFDVVDRRELSYEVEMTHEDVAHEALMGPTAHHVAPTDLTARVAELPEPVVVTVSVTVGTYRVR
ncbi:putative RNA methyltransferase [Georgenia sunbinii]|uniref:putative RNA methyltransferase n=1 Tax=Georgenia sunbinii TaxID=3117728 RepID=UPI002F26D238